MENMNALFIVLNNTTVMDDVIAKLVSLGVRGATIVDSQGMAGAILQKEIRTPLFGALKTMFDGDYPYSKTIFSVITDDDLLNQAIEGVKEIVSELKRPGAGFMFTVPVGNIYKLGTKVTK